MEVHRRRRRAHLRDHNHRGSLVLGLQRQRAVGGRCRWHHTIHQHLGLVLQIGPGGATLAGCRERLARSNFGHDWPITLMRDHQHQQGLLLGTELQWPIGWQRLGRTATGPGGCLWHHRDADGRPNDDRLRNGDVRAKHDGFSNGNCTCDRYSRHTEHQVGQRHYRRQPYVRGDEDGCWLLLGGQQFGAGWGWHNGWHPERPGVGWR